VKYLELASDFNEIVVMLHSSHLSEATLNAQEAADAVRGRISVQVIDTLTISVGLGYLVEAAASAAIANTPSTEIERTMRGMIPRIYSVFCVPGLTYLYSAGHLGKAQALVGEMLNILPIFSLEEGRLTPVEKMRNPRHLIDFLQEYMDEFSDLDQISIVQGTPPLIHEIKIIKDHIAEYFPDTPLSEHTINLPAATMLGPRTLGFFLVEQANGSS
jgi:DegV family protein with EDD domain